MNRLHVTEVGFVTPTTEIAAKAPRLYHMFRPVSTETGRPTQARLACARGSESTTLLYTAVTHGTIEPPMIDADQLSRSILGR